MSVSPTNEFGPQKDRDSVIDHFTVSDAILVGGQPQLKLR